MTFTIFISGFNDFIVVFIPRPFDFGNGSIYAGWVVEFEQERENVHN